MFLVRPSSEILFSPSDIEKSIESIARVCYKSEDKIKEGSAQKFVQMLKNRGHSAMLEFGGSITVKFICDRGVSHELVRHRICSFAQSSTRYCNYSRDKFGSQVTFVIPPWVDLVPGAYHGQYPKGKEDWDLDNDPIIEWYLALLGAEGRYLKLLAKGWSPQQARSVLPNSLMTEIIVQANTREWMHIFEQRTSKAAHPQMIELMVPLLKEFAYHYSPTLYGELYEQNKGNLP